MEAFHGTTCLGLGPADWEDWQGFQLAADHRIGAGESADEMHARLGAPGHKSSAKAAHNLDANSPPN